MATNLQPLKNSKV